VVSHAWFAPIARAMALDKSPQQRHCILLWMTGGPSQLDTFDLKPNHANGGEFKEIATAVPGVRFSEHLPKLAAQSNQLAIVRGLSTKEGDHNRGTYFVRTGQRPGSPVRYPSVGSALAKELANLSSSSLPPYVSVNPSLVFGPDGFGPGFLGPEYAPATVGGADDALLAADVAPENQSETAPAAANRFAQLRVDNLALPADVTAERAALREKFWNRLQAQFLATHPVASALAHDTVYRRALKTMHSDDAAAFHLSLERDEIREAYGRGTFGQGCLLARRLIERGVPFVEVTLGANRIAWDTHQNNFATVRNLSQELDAGWSMLMRELNERGLLERTTILWIGEFGRTPRINPQAGRDHFPNAWTCVFAGGGIRGGQSFGETSADGMEINDGQVAVGDVLATLCAAVGVDPHQENISDLGRPIKLAEGSPIAQLLD
jgi:hypothetical protein